MLDLLLTDGDISVFSGILLAIGFAVSFFIIWTISDPSVFTNPPRDTRSGCADLFAFVVAGTVVGVVFVMLGGLLVWLRGG